MCPRLLLILCLAGLIFSPLAAQTQTDLFRYVSPDAAVLARIDVRSMLDSPLVKKVLRDGKIDLNGETFSIPTDQLEGLKALTGVDLLQDIDEIVLSGALDDEESTFIAVRGRWEEARLTALLKFADGYSKSTMGSASVHHWKDDGENFAAFPSDGLLLFSKKKSVLQSALGKERAAHPALTVMEASVAQPAFFLSVTNPTCDLEPMWRNLQLRSLVLTSEPVAENFAFNLYGEGKTSDVMLHLRAILRGVKSIGMLQSEVPALHRLAERFTVKDSQGPQLGAMVLSPQDLLEIAAAGKGQIVLGNFDRDADRPALVMALQTDDIAQARRILNSIEKAGFGDWQIYTRDGEEFILGFPASGNDAKTLEAWADRLRDAGFVGAAIVGAEQSAGLRPLQSKAQRFESNEATVSSLRGSESLKEYKGSFLPGDEFTYAETTLMIGSVTEDSVSVMTTRDGNPSRTQMLRPGSAGLLDGVRAIVRGIEKTDGGFVVDMIVRGPAGEKEATFRNTLRAEDELELRGYFIRVTAISQSNAQVIVRNPMTTREITLHPGIPVIVDNLELQLHKIFGEPESLKVDLSARVK